jgi:hypothetical protein
MKPLKKADALKLAQKKFGKDAFVRDHGLTFHDGELRPVDAEDRAKLKAKLDTIKEAEPKIAAIVHWPDETTLGEYKAALAAHHKAHDKWQKLRDTARSKCLSSRFAVGHVTQSGLFSMIAGTGDASWEEALRNARCLPPEGLEESQIGLQI